MPESGMTTCGGLLRLACPDPQGDFSPRGIGRAVYRVGLVHISQAVVLPRPISHCRKAIYRTPQGGFPSRHPEAANKAARRATSHRAALAARYIAWVCPHIAGRGIATAYIALPQGNISHAARQRTRRIALQAPTAAFLLTKEAQKKSDQKKTLYMGRCPKPYDLLKRSIKTSPKRSPHCAVINRDRACRFFC
ncbi:MAG: hypothetical protein IKM08_03825 [Clostridia bacterium]|nr:hypothetical protein [Clostridia bacterium]